MKSWQIALLFLIAAAVIFAVATRKPCNCGEDELPKPGAE